MHGWTRKGVSIAKCCLVALFETASPDWYVDRKMSVELFMVPTHKIPLVVIVKSRAGVPKKYTYGGKSTFLTKVTKLRNVISL